MAIGLYQASCAIRMPIFWHQQFLFHVMGIFTQACLAYWYIFGAPLYQFCCDYVLFSSAMTASMHARIHPALQALQMFTSLIFQVKCEVQVWFFHFGSALTFWECWNDPSYLSRCMAMQIDLRFCLGWLSDHNLLQCDLWPTHYALSQHTLGQHDWRKSPGHSVDRKLPYKHIP